MQPQSARRSDKRSTRDIQWAETKDRFNALTTKITAEDELLAGLKQKVADQEETDARLASLPEQREATYIKIFEAVSQPQLQRRARIAPLREAQATLPTNSRRTHRFAPDGVYRCIDWTEDAVFARTLQLTQK